MTTTTECVPERGAFFWDERPLFGGLVLQGAFGSARRRMCTTSIVLVNNGAPRHAHDEATMGFRQPVVQNPRTLVDINLIIKWEHPSDKRGRGVRLNQIL